ncbi:ParA family protein [Curtobacterium sp. TC1]|uniref:ParA family protein n=1 Tax=Curtobacterium sp. TC1 TaxID=2862880 RepID=UPI0021BED6C7|nr:ParA family protein [Curtobacterium sp. TC1]
MKLTDEERSSLDRVIVCINGKGGVLKTTLVANISGLLAASGYRVLAVDLDPQGNLAEDFGYTGDARDDDGRSLAQTLLFGGVAQPVRDVRPGLDVLVGGSALDQATAGLAARANKDPNGAKLALANVLASIASDYDMILLDCPPGDEMLQTAAVAAARWALVPVKTDKSSRKGLSAVAARLDAVLDINPTLDLLGVVLTAVGSGSTNVERRARGLVAEMLNSEEDIVFEPTVRHSEATAQATRERGLLVHELDAQVQDGPKWYEIRRGTAEAQVLAPQTASSVADDLHALTTALVERISQSEHEGADA